MLPPVFGVLFDGFAFGMLLFLLSVGLSVTLGMMNFINLAHCAFGMLGGYVAVTLVNGMGWPFLAALPMAFLAAAIVAVVLERLLYRRLYRASELDQVLLTIGITFMSVATAAYIYGTIQQPIQTPSYLRGSIPFLGLHLGTYRVFLVVTGLLVTLLLVATLEYTRFGARVRAAVDNQRMAAGLGINVEAAFAITFALGGRLRGLGGALAIGIVGLDHSIIRLSRVCADRGLSGRARVHSRLVRRGLPARHQRYVRQVLLSRARRLSDLSRDGGNSDVAAGGPVREAVMAPPAAATAPYLHLEAQTRWGVLETAFWVCTLLPFLVFPSYLVLASQIAITGLFALSIDLVLGYAGIVTLGHAAFFGLGAYGAGLFAKFVWGEPLPACCLRPGLPPWPDTCRALSWSASGILRSS
jgi:branched-chain amino acid transport system permease protein